MEAKKSNQISVNPIILVLGAVIFLGLGFLGGQIFQKGKNGGSIAQVQQQVLPGANGGGMGRGAMRGGFGEVTAVTDISITVKNSFSRESVEYIITSSTKVTDNNETATLSDIKTGDTVMVQTASVDSREATEIRLNVQMPSGEPGMRSSQSGTTIQTN